MAKLIKINLNQTISKAELNEIKAEQQKWIIFGSICILFIVLSAWFFIINNSMSNLITAREGTIDEIIARTNKLKKEGQINLSKSDIESLYKVEEKRIIWSTKLKEFANIIPEDMTITNVHYKQKRLIISAISRLQPNEKDFQSIERFIALIEKSTEFSTHFSKPTLKKSELDKSEGQEFLSFDVELKLKKTKKSKRKSKK